MENVEKKEEKPLTLDNVDLADIHFNFGKLKQLRNGVSLINLPGVGADTLYGWEAQRRMPRTLDVFLRFAVGMARYYNDPRYLDLRMYIQLVKKDTQPKIIVDNRKAEE